MIGTCPDRRRDGPSVRFHAGYVESGRIVEIVGVRTAGQMNALVDVVVAPSAQIASDESGRMVMVDLGGRPLPASLAHQVRAERCNKSEPNRQAALHDDATRPLGRPGLAPLQMRSLFGVDFRTQPTTRPRLADRV